MTKERQQEKNFILYSHENLNVADENEPLKMPDYSSKVKVFRCPFKGASNKQNNYSEESNNNSRKNSNNIISSKKSSPNITPSKEYSSKIQSEILALKDFDENLISDREINISIKSSQSKRSTSKSKQPVTQNRREDF